MVKMQDVFFSFFLFFSVADKAFLRFFAGGILMSTQRRRSADIPEKCCRSQLEPLERVCFGCMIGASFSVRPNSPNGRTNANSAPVGRSWTSLSMG